MQKCAYIITEHLYVTMIYNFDFKTFFDVEL